MSYIFQTDLQMTKQKCQKFDNAVKPYLKNKNLRIRVEGKHFNIFCADISLLKDLDRDLSQWIAKISGPTTQEEYDFLMSNGNKKVLCDQFPHNKFKYKLIFNTDFPIDNRKSFYDWLKNYKDKINMANSCESWLSNKKRYVYHNPYMYVEDAKTTSMITLYAGNNIKSIVEYVERDCSSSINITLCQH